MKKDVFRNFAKFLRASFFTEYLWTTASSSWRITYKNLEESLTVNQYLVEKKLNTLKSLLTVIQNEISENKAESKDQ